MLQIQNIFVLFVFLVTHQSCCNSDDCHKTIDFINNSPKDVWVLASDLYPDTLGIQERQSPIYNEFMRVNSNESSLSSLFESNCYEDLLNPIQPFMNDKIMIYVLDDSLVQSMSWEDITHNYLILKRYDLSLEDLVSRNWQIEFTLNE